MNNTIQTYPLITLRNSCRLCGLVSNRNSKYGFVNITNYSLWCCNPIDWWCLKTIYLMSRHKLWSKWQKWDKIVRNDKNSWNRFILSYWTRQTDRQCIRCINRLGVSIWTIGNVFLLKKYWSLQWNRSKQQVSR